MGEGDAGRAADALRARSRAGDRAAHRGSESGGRAFVGIGRGDSALAKIGRRPERLDAFAIVGPAERAVERLRRLAAIGLDFVTIAPGSAGMGWEQGWRSIEAIGREVIPALR